MRLLGEIRPLEVKLKIFNPSRRAAVEGRVDQGLEDAPDFGPAITDRKTKGVRMLETENRYIRIIVKGNVVRPPPEQHRKPIGHHQADGRAHCGRPAVGCAEGGPRPVEPSDTLRHLADAGEPIA